MKNIYNSIIPLSFLGLWLTSLLPSKIEILVGFFLIFTFGILHGSNDLLLIDKISNSRKKNYSFIRVFIIYIIAVLVGLISFYIVPFMAFVLFLIFSAFHFGQQHWEHKNLDISTTFKNVYYFFYGIFILNLLLIFNTTEVVDVILSITNVKIEDQILRNSLIIFTLNLSILTGILMYKSKKFPGLIIFELLYILIFIIIFKVSELIWGFAIYFILWHSIPSLYEQIYFIYGECNLKNFFKYFKKAFPVWLVSLVFIAIMVLVMKDEKLFYGLFFSCIAAVTFPHTLVINKLFSNKKTQPN